MTRDGQAGGPKKNSDGSYWVRLRMGGGARARVSFTVATPRAAAGRAEALEELAAILRPAKQRGHAGALIQEAARAADVEELARVRRVALGLVGGKIVAATAPVGDDRMTFRALGEAWTSGRLHREHPDHVREKRTSRLDASRLEHLCVTIGDVIVSDFTLEDADRAMAALPTRVRRSATRRQYAQVIFKLVGPRGYAVYPLRLLKVSPIPSGWLPTITDRRSRQYLFPDEDRHLLQCTALPLEFRVFYGLLAREGFRSASEALQLRIRDVDFKRGLVHCVYRKKNETACWTLDPGVQRALKCWVERHRADASENAALFPGVAGEPKPAERFREHLALAGVAGSRPALLEDTADQQHVVLHDLRATFITVAMANGRSEGWIMDRTGHTTSAMLNRYRRRARTFAEAQLGELTPLDVAIPELAPRARAGARGGGPGPRVRGASNRGGGQQGGQRGGQRRRRGAPAAHPRTPCLPNHFSSVAKVGLEPTRPCGQRILSPPRLPFRHSALVERVGS